MNFSLLNVVYEHPIKLTYTKSYEAIHDADESLAPFTDASGQLIYRETFDLAARPYTRCINFDPTNYGLAKPTATLLSGPRRDDTRQLAIQVCEFLKTTEPTSTARSTLTIALAQGAVQLTQTGVGVYIFGAALQWAGLHDALTWRQALSCGAIVGAIAGYTRGAQCFYDSTRMHDVHTLYYRALRAKVTFQAVDNYFGSRTDQLTQEIAAIERDLHRLDGSALIYDAVNELRMLRDAAYLG
ncbi:MAG: hypothetical protein EOO77_36855 [Oxalobacteraceae bacterium]|nr:MAG: hypothetical protein EOO77_36855 [Oxalobacteraceae bacterium]